VRGAYAESTTGCRGIKHIVAEERSRSTAKPVGETPLDDTEDWESVERGELRADAVEITGELNAAESRVRHFNGTIPALGACARRITDAIPQAIVVLDPVGTPLYANRAMLDYTGLAMEDIVKSGFRERVFHPDDFQRLVEYRKSALAGGVPFELEQRALGKDSQYRWFLIHYNPFRDEQGRIVRWYATGTDINERKRNEERTRNENVALREDFDHSHMFEEIVGSSQSLRRVLKAVDKVASTDSTVLILGETGTGKEVVARSIHAASDRRGVTVGARTPVKRRAQTHLQGDLCAGCRIGRERQTVLSPR